MDAGGYIRYSGGTREQFVTDYRETTSSGSYEQSTRNMSWPGYDVVSFKLNEPVDRKHLTQSSAPGNTYLPVILCKSQIVMRVAGCSHGGVYVKISARLGALRS